MLFRHWASTILAASFAVSVVGCSNSNEAAPESGGQTVSAEPAEDSAPKDDADHDHASGHEDGDQHADEEVAEEASEESHDGKPLEIEGVGSFKTLFAAIDAAGLKDTLSEGAPFTVFAPTDEAFAALPDGTLDDLLKPENKEKLASILTYHVVSGRVPAEQVVGIESADTVNGKALAVVADDSGVTVGEAKVLKADIECEVGLIHAIDRVLIP
jgi:uncharacterized surface protein with fasciclin (FAS1) repeats